MSTPSASSARRHWSSPVVGGFSSVSAQPRVRFIVRVVEFIVSVGFVLATLSPGSPKYALGLAAAAVSGVAWLTWIVSGEDRRRSLVALIVLAMSAGVCGAAPSADVGTRSTGTVFVGLSAAATAFSSGLALGMIAFLLSLGGFLATNAVYGPFPGDVKLMAAIGLGAIVFGGLERQVLERGRESTLLATAERRVALADHEAQLASERNRLGREIHDVLAHTLGAVSIQLAALDTRLAAGDPPEALRDRVRGLHGLVGDGLLEARDAVRALRDDKLSLETQIKRLCALHGAALSVAGRSRPLRADEALALYRVVQEALTNAAKHAAGAAVHVGLTYDQAAVTIVVDSERGTVRDAPLARTGGGHGLEGMRARVALVGGVCAAGPHADGWRVTATLPRG